MIFFLSMAVVANFAITELSNYLILVLSDVPYMWYVQILHIPHLI